MWARSPRARSLIIIRPVSTLGFGIVSFPVLAGQARPAYAFGSLAGWLIGARGCCPLWRRMGAGSVTPSRRDAAERWFDRYGSLAVLIGRVTPLIRLFIWIPAGVFSVPLTHDLPSLVGPADLVVRLRRAETRSGYPRVDNAFQSVESPSSQPPVSGLAPADSPAVRRHRDKV